MSKKIYTDSVSGRRVTKEYADANPSTTQGSAVTPRTETSKFLSRLKKLAAKVMFTGGESSEPAPFTVFKGKKATKVTGDILLKQIRRTDADVQQREAGIFFTNLITNSETKEVAVNLANLHSALADNLRDLTVFAVGKIEVDIYLVGISNDGFLCGIKTESIET